MSFQEMDYTTPKPVSIQKVLGQAITLLETVEYNCWACGQVNFWNNYSHGIEPKLMRCKPCADRDGELNLDAWIWILKQPDQPSAYAQVIDGFDWSQKPTFDETRIVIPAIYRTATPMDSVAEWSCNNRNESPLVMMGPTGTGKTYQACAALMLIVRKLSSGTGKLVNCASLNRTFSQQLDEIMNLAVVVLDDLGSRISPAAAATAYEIIDHRLANRLPLIVTTNLTMTALSQLDERIASRLCSGFILPFNGEDRRII